MGKSPGLGCSMLTLSLAIAAEQPKSLSWVCEDRSKGPCFNPGFRQGFGNPPETFALSLLGKVASNAASRPNALFRMVHRQIE